MATDIESANRSGLWWSIAAWGAAAFLLLLPAVAMQFTEEVNWDLEDFVVIGTILALACGTFELAGRTSNGFFYRSGTAVGIGTVFLLIVVNLAVGFFGDEGNPANLAFLAVFGVALVAAVRGRFRPAGMVQAMVLAAAAQGMIGVIGYISGWGSPAPTELYVVTIASTLFTSLWLFAAWLFHLSAGR